MHHEEKHPQCCAGLDVLCKQKNLHQTAPRGSSEQPDEAGTDAWVRVSLPANLEKRDYQVWNWGMVECDRTWHQLSRPALNS